MLGITAKARKSSDKQTFVTMSGMAGNCSGKIHHNSTGQTAEIYSSDGEMIASYNSNGDGWTIEQTKAESKFLQESSMIYKQAFCLFLLETSSGQDPLGKFPFQKHFMKLQETNEVI